MTRGVDSGDDDNEDDDYNYDNDDDQRIKVDSGVDRESGR